MATRYVFDDRQAFLARLKGLLDAGVPREEIRALTPCHVPEAEALLFRRPGRLRFFAFLGALAGFGGGMVLTTYTVLSWPLIVGGKPIVSIPPFLLISYLLTILFGSLGAFAGFLLLARLPSGRGLAADAEFPERFVIVVEKGEGA
jgi:hypothetical protein